MKKSKFCSVALLCLLCMTKISTAQRQEDPRLDSLMKSPDSANVKATIENYLAGPDERDVNLAVQYYAQKNDIVNFERADSIAVKKFPHGRFAYIKKGNALVGEKDAEKKEQLLHQLLQQFPKNEGNGMYYFDVANTYAEKKGDDAAVLLKIRSDWKHINNNGFRLVVANTLYKTGYLSTAAGLVKATMDTMQTHDPHSMHANYEFLYAKILNRQGHPGEALKHAQASYNATKEPGWDMINTYSLLLMENHQDAAAMPLMVKAYKAGQATDEVKDSMKVVYTRTHGTPDGFEQFIAGIEKELKDSVNVEIGHLAADKAPAPNFTLRNLKGEQVSLADLKGKVVVLDFWATWCGPCKRSFPAMQKAVNKYKNDPGVVFLFIDTWERVNDPKPGVEDYMRSSRYTFNVLLDLADSITRKNNVVESYGVTGIPTKFIIDRNGRIAYRLTGFSGGDDFAVQELTAMIENSRSAPALAKTHTGGPLAVGDDAPTLAVGSWLKGDPGQGLVPGKVTVVEFWATWCRPCLAGIPHLSAVAEKYKTGDVKVFGVSVMERKGVDQDSMMRFINGPIGRTMDYVVGRDDASKDMQKNWLLASGDGGIPYAMIVDQHGKIAWTGQPQGMDKPLEAIVAGTWDLTAARKTFLQDKMMDSLGQTLIPQLNAFIQNKKFAEGLTFIDSLKTAIPEITYRGLFYHYTLVYMMKLDPEKAVAYARQGWAANSIPDWRSASDVIDGSVYRKEQLPPAAYVLGIDAFKAQLEHYPWSMDFPRTYDDMASFAWLAGDKQQAVEYETKAVDGAREDRNVSASDRAKMTQTLKKYKG